MSVLVTTRAGKGTPLTNNELDANFNNIVSAVEALQSAGSENVTLLAHLFPGATAAAQAVNALKSLNVNGTVNLASPVTLDLRGCASPMVLDVNIVESALAAYDKTRVAWLWGSQEVRVAAVQKTRSHHHHDYTAGPLFVSKDASGTRVTGTTMFVHYHETYGIGGPGNGVITTDGSAVITKAAPSVAAWGYLEVGSPITLFGFVPPIGYDNNQLNGAIDNAVTTITVDATTGFTATAGYIRIEDELVAYTGMTGTTFTGCTRGFGGTTAASHLDNAAVYRPVYQPFYVKSISGNDITLDGPVDFSSTNASITIGPLDLTFVGPATFDGNYIYNTDDSVNPYGIQVIGGRHCYIRGPVFQNFDHGGFNLEQCQDSGFDIPAIAKVGHYPAQVLGVGAWVFGWNKRIVGRLGSVEECYDGLAVDDRSTTPSLRDGPCQDSDFYVGTARNHQYGVLLHGASDCRVYVGRASDLSATGAGVAVGGTQWVTGGPSVRCIVDVGPVSGTAGFSSIIQAGAGAGNMLISRTPAAVNTVADGNSLSTPAYQLGLTYSASITPDMGRTTDVSIIATDTVAFIIQNPTNKSHARELSILLTNSAGAPHGAISWGTLYKLAGALPAIADTKSARVTFRWNGAYLFEVSRTADMG